MDNWAILATGESMSQQLADSLRGFRAVVVSDAYRLAPWAEAMVSQDAAWWIEHPDAKKFSGMKFSTNANIAGVEQFDSYQRVGQAFGTGCNSGLIACLVAQWLGAKKIGLYGFDMKGDHFFGKHREPLKNPTPSRYAAMRQDFARWNHDGIEVINMTPGSALDCFKRGV
jgi:hypothetical protein